MAAASTIARPARAPRQRHESRTARGIYAVVGTVLGVLYTFPVALLNVETGTFGQVNYGYLVAGAVIAIVPCVVLYLTLQRYYVQGLTSGAVKG